MGAGGGVESVEGISVGGAEEPCDSRFLFACTLVRLDESNGNILENIKINHIPLGWRFLCVFAAWSVAPSQPRGELSALILGENQF